VGAETLWLALLFAGTNAYLNWRRWQHEVEARQEVNAQRRRAEDRLLISRELHDVVAHTLAVVGVHLNVALDAVDDSPAEAREALRLAQEVRGKAMADLASLVGVLREEAAGPGIAELVDRVRSAGLEVTLDERGDRAAVPAAVAVAAYRVVQEALTNTVRHAGASRVAVTVSYAADHVGVAVVDNGRAEPGPAGNGIEGMRERVTALGGTFSAGPADGGGFAVRARMPR
jgi:signal transduction histidine kinase